MMPQQSIAKEATLWSTIESAVGQLPPALVFVLLVVVVLAASYVVIKIKGGR